MKAKRLPCALLVGIVSGAITACGSSSTSPSPATNNDAVVGMAVRGSTVEPITTPGTVWLYRLLYDVRKTGGKTGATLTLAHWALSNGFATNDTFSGSGVLQVPRVGRTARSPSNLTCLC
jgi:hypothetical protein